MIGCSFYFWLFFWMDIILFKIFTHSFWRLKIWKFFFRWAIRFIKFNWLKIMSWIALFGGNPSI
ncbi:unnamed protein product [Meloidogyne enterolobii]|uniref:Uncharacterized protein n=1 Tax=Meloidogyne enterolobii TaxID=390850 RepID=A0ACB1AGC3_MELEN